MRFPTSAPLLRLQGTGKLAEKIRKGHTDEIDNEILRSLRRPEDPAIPIRPAWLPEVARDFTALEAECALRWFRRSWSDFSVFIRFRAAGYLIASLGSGMLACQLLKKFFVRRRPTVVPHLTSFDLESFPSGHSMGSGAGVSDPWWDYFAAGEGKDRQALLSFSGVNHRCPGTHQPALSGRALSHGRTGGLGRRRGAVEPPTLQVEALG